MYPSSLTSSFIHMLHALKVFLRFLTAGQSIGCWVAALAHIRSALPDDICRYLMPAY
jgi:hypothetical protein